MAYIVAYRVNLGSLVKSCELSWGLDPSKACFVGEPSKTCSTLVFVTCDQSRNVLVHQGYKGNETSEGVKFQLIFLGAL